MTALHTTNYKNTFIQVAEDTPAITGEIPPLKGDKKSVANLQYEMISRHPYAYTSDDVLFEVFASKNDLTKKEKPAARVLFFSKGQPCFRASPLTKRYGWGVHFDSEGKMAVYGLDSTQYSKLVKDKNLQQLKAMRSARK